MDTLPIVATTKTEEQFSPEYLDEVLVCRRLKKAIAEGITDPMKLAEVCGLPVCLIAKFPGVNSIAADAVTAQLDRHRRERHAQELAAKHAKKPKSYSELAELVPIDTSSPEAEKISTAFKLLLRHGNAPRLDFLERATGLTQEVISAQLKTWPWVKREVAELSGIEVFLPSEARA